MALPLAAIAAIGAGLGAVGSLGSTAIQNQGQWLMQQDAQSFNAHEAQLARDFTRQEAATARQFSHDEAELARQFSHDEAQLARDFEAQKYQRTVADMQAAGLNPASVLGGSGAVSSSSPVAASSMAQSSMAGAGSGASSGIGSLSNANLGSILVSAFNSAMIEEMKNEHFVTSLAERTAYHASQIDAHLHRTDTWHQQRKSNDPDWFKDYKKSFESGVTDL